MPELSMHFLGAVALALDGVPVHLHRRRSLALLAYLVLTGRPHTRDALAALLSGEVDDSQARKLLRNALTDLGEHGIGEFLLIDRQTIAFNTALPHHIDLSGLDDLLIANSAPDPGALARAARWEENLLADLSLRDAPLFEAWLLREREQLRHRLAQLAHRLLEHYLHADNVGAGIALARRLLEIEPWQETIHRQLMRLLARDGQATAALAQYDLCRRALAAEFGVEPQPETTVLYDRLRVGPSAPHRNFTTPTTDLIGREAELAATTRLLASPTCRLLTLVGLGGCGKTRLALAAATYFADPVPFPDEHPYPGGIYLVDLADIAGPGPSGDATATAERRLVMAIGLALGFCFYGNADRLDQLVAYLRPKRMLLILDNLEHLAEGAATLQALLRGAPEITLLVTSRTRLEIPEEWVREVPGLALPENGERLDQAPASQLFLHEALRLNVPLGTEDFPHIAQICRYVGGLPLALVIMAGRLRAASCAEIARELAQGGALLDWSSRDQPARHRSLRAITLFAWKGLRAREQQALRQLAVFHGRFDRAASEAVGVMLPSLSTLCEQSLVERDGRDGYVLHPLLRQHAVDQLARRPTEEARARARHAAYYASVLDFWAAALFRRPEAHAAIGAERANILAAWEWAVAHLDLGLLTRMREGLTTWYTRAGLNGEWAELLAEAVERLRTAPVDQAEPAMRVTLGWLLTTRAGALIRQRELDCATPLLVEARQCARTVGMISLEAWIGLYEWRIRRYRGDIRAGSALLQQTLILSRAIQERLLEAETLVEFGAAAIDLGQVTEGEAQLLRGEQAYRELGDRLTPARIAIQRARLFIARADFARAKVYLEQNLSLIREFGDHPRELQARLFLGITCDTGMGRHQEASEHFARAAQINLELGDVRSDAFLRWGQGCNALHIGDYSRAGEYFEQATDLGRLVGSPSVLGRALHAKGMLAHSCGDDRAAADLAQQALHLTVDSGQLQDRAPALILLGQAREGLGGLSEAGAAYTQALAIAREFALPHRCCEAEVGLASVALALGAPGRAVGHIAAAVPYLRDHGLAGCDEPGWVALICHRALRAVGDPQAGEVLGLGATLLQQRAAMFPAAEQSRYLGATPARRELLQRWHDHQATVIERQSRPPISLFPAAFAAESENYSARSTSAS